MASATALIWRVLMVAEKRFRRLNAPKLLLDVHEGNQFVNGRPVTQGKPTTNMQHGGRRLSSFTHHLTGSLLLAAELDIVRPRTGVSLIGVRLLSFVSAPVVLSAAISLTAAAADPRFSVGVRVGADWIPSAKVVATADTPTAEVFARLSLAPSSALELAVGYRHFHYYEFGGRWSDEYSLTQVPIAFGLHYVLSPARDVRPTFGAGIHCSVTRDSFSTYLYPNSYQTEERSKVVLGGYGQLGVQFRLGPTVFGDIMARYVFNPVSSGTGEPSNQDYVRLQAGIGARF